ncbi:hypothetical protein B0H34DRAFT_703340 [Crassisporium funariophilum]|nr:hypothetical protein B0H34DRAFT_703340 [Crassisporium funariophilum]
MFLMSLFSTTASITLALPKDAEVLAVPSLAQHLPLLTLRYKHSCKRLVVVNFEGTSWQCNLLCTSHGRGKSAHAR